MNVLLTFPSSFNIFPNFQCVTLLLVSSYVPNMFPMNSLCSFLFLGSHSVPRMFPICSSNTFSYNSLYIFHNIGNCYNGTMSLIFYKPLQWCHQCQMSTKFYWMNNTLYENLQMISSIKWHKTLYNTW